MSLSQSVFRSSGALSARPVTYVPRHAATAHGARSTPGAHREPGVGFWVVTWRELLWAVSLGSLRLWSPPPAVHVTRL